MNGRVFISCAGGASGQTVLRLLRGADIGVTLIAGDRDPLSFAQELADEFYVVEADVESGEYGDSLLKVISANGIDAAIPCHSGELNHFVRNGAELDRLGTRWHRPNGQYREVLGDKIAMYGVLEKAGISVPPYAAMTDPPERVFPADRVVLKRRHGGGARGLCFCGPREELPEDVRWSLFDYLEQVMVEGDELSLDGMVLSNDKVVGPLARRRQVIRGGAAIVSESIDVPESTKTLYRQVASAVGTRGPLNVQVFADGDRILGVTDVNPRFPSGGMALAAEMGLNLPVLAVTDLLDGPEAADIALPPFRSVRHYKTWGDFVRPL